MSEEAESQYAGEFHRWTCCFCDETNEEDNDPRGDTLTCVACGTDSTVVGV